VAGEIRVFDNASMLTTSTPPVSRTITPGGSNWFLFVEPTKDRLYAVSGNQVLIIPNASATTSIVGATLITVPGTGSEFGAVAVKP